MLFKVEMTVNPPKDIDPDSWAGIVAREKAYAQELQHAGTWRHLWRVTGLYANISIFDVESPQALHDLLMKLPLYPYMEIAVTSLCQHPSAIKSIDDA
ncbi:MAG: muconolactone Delta-isomerase [Pseudomonadota bacterium]